MLQFCVFWILQALFNIVNRVIRYLFKQCFMFGPDDPSKAIRVRVHARAKSRGTQAVEELATLDNFIFTFDSHVDDVEMEVDRPEVSLYGFTLTQAIFSSVAPGRTVWCGTFSSVDQFNMADRLVIVPLDHFISIMDRWRKTREGHESPLRAPRLLQRLLLAPRVPVDRRGQLLLAAVTSLSQGPEPRVFIKMVQPCLSQLDHLATPFQSL